LFARPCVLICNRISHLQNVSQAHGVEMLEDAVIAEVWFFDGDEDHVLGCVEDDPAGWLIEKGVLREESDLANLEDLLEGDVVYRIRKRGLRKRALDPREPLFDWEEVVLGSSGMEEGFETAKIS
jgi:hypothetical protein